MLKFKLAKPMLAALAACAASVAFNGVVLRGRCANTGAEEIKCASCSSRWSNCRSKSIAWPLSRSAGRARHAGDEPGQGKDKEASTEPKFDKFLKGFYRLPSMSPSTTRPRV